MAFTAELPKHQGIINNDGFFPDLHVIDLQKRYRLDDEISQESLLEELLKTVILVNNQLETWACKQVKQGYSTLLDIPSMEYSVTIPSISNNDTTPTETTTKTALQVLYEQAIFARVKADISRDYADHDLTAKGRTRLAQDKTLLSDDYYRESTWAIRKIQGKRTTKVALL